MVLLLDVIPTELVGHNSHGNRLQEALLQLAGWIAQEQSQNIPIMMTMMSYWMLKHWNPLWL